MTWNWKWKKYIVTFKYSYLNQFPNALWYGFWKECSIPINEILVCFHFDVDNNIDVLYVDYIVSITTNDTCAQTCF
jgi:hypothetical protein